MVVDTFNPELEQSGRRARRALAARSGPAPRPWVPSAGAVVACAGLVLVVVLGLASESRSDLAATGGMAIFVGGLTGLVGMYLALVMVLLASRLPPVERALGQDGLLRWHRRLGPWAIGLLVVHAVVITFGYAQAAKTGVWHEIGTFVSSYPDMLAAIVGLGLMLMAGVVSIRAVRQRVRRETWWAVHLYMYLALALSFAHVIVLGPSFVGHPLTRVVWSLVWAATAGVVLVARVALPVARSLRYQLKVAEVRREGPDVVSIVCAGRQLQRLPVSGGQFLLWRFLTKGLWWQAHPYSLSALPRPPYLRLTVKAVGDHSAALAELRPGTRVAFEGPYGAFTRHAQLQPHALLVAGGIGVTALRALLEDLPARSRPEVILRARRPEDLALRDEVAELVRHRKGRLHELVGTRQQVRLDRRTVRQLVPDVVRRDAYVCGPEAFVAEVVGVLAALGVPRSAIHHEAFSL